MTQTEDTPDEQPFIDFIGPSQWRSWLVKHHDSESGMWLRIAKKDSGKSSITITEALDVALSYGWIDSRRRGYDESYYLQRYSPRRPKSPWSLINVKKAEILVADVLMQPSGYKEIYAAQADGRWDVAYESQKTAGVPMDLIKALGRSEKACHVFDQLDKSQQYILFLPMLKATSLSSRTIQLQKVIASLEAVQ